LNISTLIALALTGNHLSREVPYDLGSSLPILKSLELGGNYSQGRIPPTLSNASNLFVIDISANNFTGVVPSSLGKLTQLSILNLELNKLQANSKQDWEFFNNLANCSKLQALSLAFNQLEGQVPSSLGNLSVQLQRLYLGNNQLSGSFPMGIKHLPNLIVLGLEKN
jgi:Leucine-rich repeat (LRR) protein